LVLLLLQEVVEVMVLMPHLEALHTVAALVEVLGLLHSNLLGREYLVKAIVVIMVITLVAEAEALELLVLQGLLILLAVMVVRVLLLLLLAQLLLMLEAAEAAVMRVALEETVV
jgi:hypothetical protein